MQKYKVVASKSQKKYTMIISANSDQEARERIHKEWYSILSSQIAKDTDVVGQKFLFQVESGGKIKNGVIIGKDIYKVYIKLRDELGYNIICLYPEGDEAHNNAEKKQKILRQLEKWYMLQKQQDEIVEKKQKKENTFYLKKELDEVSVLIHSVIEKLERLISESWKYNVDKVRLVKLQQLYNKLIQIKGSTNLSKLREIGELALIKIWEIELQSIEQDKNEESSFLLQETNDLLKKIWSDQHFIRKDKDIKLMIWNFFQDLKKSLSLWELKKSAFQRKEKELIDTQSYGFLKTVLLLEKYKDKLKENTKDIRKNVVLFLNPFSNSEKKAKLLLTRKVLKQNISILKAKKTWSLSSYTGVKKWYHKLTENIFNNIKYFRKVLLFGIVFYSLLFLISWVFVNFNIGLLLFNTQALSLFLIFFFLFFLFTFSRNIFLTLLSIVFFSFLFIFSRINF